jgi:hypothetical protein
MRLVVGDRWMRPCWRPRANLSVPSREKLFSSHEVMLWHSSNLPSGETIILDACSRKWWARDRTFVKREETSAGVTTKTTRESTPLFS